MHRLVIIALALPLLATQATAEEHTLYSAHESLRRAQVGTFSPRLAPPVRVTPAAKAVPSQFERMTCKTDPSRPLGQTIICRSE